MVEQPMMSAAMQDLAERLKRAEMELLISIRWAAWNTRNLFLFEAKQVDSLITLAKAEAIIESYKRFKIPSQDHMENEKETSQPIWRPPPKGGVKINVDAANNAEHQISGLGVVLRDSEGRFVAAAVKKVPFGGGVLQAEANAVAWGIQVAKEIGTSSAIINTDSQGVAYLVNKRKDSRTSILWITPEIQDYFNEFKEFEVRFTPKLCNVKAHQRAKVALEYEKSVIWVDSFPDDRLLEVLN